MHATASRPTTRLVASALVLSLALPVVPMAAAPSPPASPLHLPWREAGLTERQAAARLLDRFAYGARPGDVDRVVAMGLDRWLEHQLAADLDDARLAPRLAAYPALEMSTAEILRTYPRPVKVIAEAVRAGVIADPRKAGSAESAESAKLDGSDGLAGPAGSAESARPDRKALRAEAKDYAREQGYRPLQELTGQLLAQKLVRAVYSENQLAEVMTDFWFNHFNVSLTDNKARPFLLSYERDAIRPQALGDVRDLLEATARHPAMLLYLDNAQSTAASGATTAAPAVARRARQRSSAERPRKRPQGLNENYARELLELHTLGVDGGYTQKDVTEVARAFTGWTIMPQRAREAMDGARAGGRRGPSGGASLARRAKVFGGVPPRDLSDLLPAGNFFFRPNLHDAGEKVILGHRLPAGRGIEDGEEVLDLLAAAPQTARHLAAQLAIRFVSDQPPPALVDRVAAVYRATGGDVRAMLNAIARSPEFWAPAARGAKIKSPFELAASALRGLGADLEEPKATLQWIAKIGQPLYAYQAPTGYPDRAESWVNTGALLNRMNFGLALAAGKVPGVEVDLRKLNGGREPESREAALRGYAAALLPERDVTAAIAQLEPMAEKPDGAGASNRAGQMVGLILGSPEFQRR